MVTATFASWLIDRVAEVEEESAAATQRDIRALTAELAELRALFTDGRETTAVRNAPGSAITRHDPAPTDPPPSGHR